MEAVRETPELHGTHHLGPDQRTVRGRAPRCRPRSARPGCAPRRPTSTCGRRCSRCCTRTRTIRGSSMSRAARRTPGRVTPAGAWPGKPTPAPPGAPIRAGGRRAGSRRRPSAPSRLRRAPEPKAGSAVRRVSPHPRDRPRPGARQSSKPWPPAAARTRGWRCTCWPPTRATRWWSRAAARPGRPPRAPGSPRHPAPAGRRRDGGRDGVPRLRVRDRRPARRVVPRAPPRSARAAWTGCSAVCDAVQHAHEHLVAHGDLRPSNILVPADAALKLLDCGMAALLAFRDGARRRRGAGAPVHEPRAGARRGADHRQRRVRAGHPALHAAHGIPAVRNRRPDARARAPDDLRDRSPTCPARSSARRRSARAGRRPRSHHAEGAAARTRASGMRTAAAPCRRSARVARRPAGVGGAGPGLVARRRRAPVRRGAARAAAVMLALAAGAGVLGWQATLLRGERDQARASLAAAERARQAVEERVARTTVTDLRLKVAGAASDLAHRRAPRRRPREGRGPVGAVARRRAARARRRAWRRARARARRRRAGVPGVALPLAAPVRRRAGALPRGARARASAGPR